MYDLTATRRMFCLRHQGGPPSDAVAGGKLGRIRRQPTASDGQTMPSPAAKRPLADAETNATRNRISNAAVRPQLRGFVFDMGDVLYDATLWRRWLFQLLGRMGLHAHYRTMFRVWDKDFLDDVHRGRREFAEAFHAFLLSLGLTRGQIDEVQAASQSRKRELELGARPLPGVRDTIERLAERGVKLAVLSDSEQSGGELQTHLGRLGLGGRFSPVISSFDLEYTKPSPVCYRAALSEMRLPIDAVAFVGHDGAELTGARAVGLRTVAFNYDAGATADHYLTRFEELLPLVDLATNTGDTVVSAA
ncbi:MAG TPA: HAD family hydrolase [Pirellulales bacterium]|nr:HAD family hydrolase [Pirellulales bacterium]